VACHGDVTFLSRCIAGITQRTADGDVSRGKQETASNLPVLSSSQIPQRIATNLPEQRPHVLAVAADKAVLRLLRFALESYGFEVATVDDAENALAVARGTSIDTVLLDLSTSAAPRLDSIASFKQLGVPVVALSETRDPATQQAAFNAGADDFISKPFDTADLAARVRYLLGGESVYGEHAVFTFDDLHLDLIRRRIVRNGSIMVLTDSEWSLLQVLAERAPDVVLYDEILARAFGDEYRDDLHYLRACMSRLRAKLGDAASANPLIRDFHGVGYRLAVPQSRSQ
jgi:two-component system, OmpR family, KDP operon response regulator KdpE